MTTSFQKVYENAKSAFFLTRVPFGIEYSADGQKLAVQEPGSLHDRRKTQPASGKHTAAVQLHAQLHRER